MILYTQKVINNLNRREKNMNKKSKEILKNVYLSYNKGEEYFKMKTPVSSQIHNFNMAVKDLEGYITFVERNIVNIKIALTDKRLEYCIEKFFTLDSKKEL